MAYLHENREEFTIAVNLASEHFSILPAIGKLFVLKTILRKPQAVLKRQNIFIRIYCFMSQIEQSEVIYDERSSIDPL